jgi:gas vesicle protein
MSSEEHSAGTSGVLLSFLLGALSGAALAILFAPRSGRETREILGEKQGQGAQCRAQRSFSSRTSTRAMA